MDGVCVHQAESEAELAFLQTLFEAEGIPLVVLNEHMSRMYLPAGDLFFPRAIMVDRSDEARARALMAQFERSTDKTHGFSNGRTWLDRFGRIAMAFFIGH